MWAILTFSPNPSGSEILFLSTLRLCKRLLLTSADTEKKVRFRTQPRKRLVARARVILTSSTSPSGYEILFLSSLRLSKEMSPNSTDPEISARLRTQQKSLFGPRNRYDFVTECRVASCSKNAHTRCLPAKGAGIGPQLATVFLADAISINLRDPVVVSAVVLHAHAQEEH